MDELKQGYCKQFGKHVPDDEIEAVFLAADTDKSGALDWNEFVRAACSKDSL